MVRSALGCRGDPPAAGPRRLSSGLDIKPEGIQAILEEVAKTDPRAKTIKPQDLIDRRFLDEMVKNGFLDKLWATK